MGNATPLTHKRQLAVTNNELVYHWRNNFLTVFIVSAHWYGNLTPLAELSLRNNHSLTHIHAHTEASDELYRTILSLRDLLVLRHIGVLYSRFVNCVCLCFFLLFFVPWFCCFLMSLCKSWYVLILLKNYHIPCWRKIRT